MAWSIMFLLTVCTNRLGCFLSFILLCSADSILTWLFGNNFPVFGQMLYFSASCDTSTSFPVLGQMLYFSVSCDMSTSLLTSSSSIFAFFAAECSTQLKKKWTTWSISWILDYYWVPSLESFCMWTTKVKISLLNHTVWSVPLFFLFLEDKISQHMIFWGTVCIVEHWGLVWTCANAQAGQRLHC